MVPEGIGIYVQLVNPLDNNTSVPRLVASAQTTPFGGVAQIPQVAIDGAGNYAIVWSDFELNGTISQSVNRVLMRRYNFDGTPVDLIPVELGTAHFINSSGSSLSVVSNSSGRLLVTWLGENGDS